MNFKKTLALVGWAVALAAGAACAEPAKSTFTLVGQTYNVTLPEGYCLPDDHTSGLAGAMASVDQQNQTDFTFFECASQAVGKVGPYGIVKTPKATLLAVLPTRADFLKQLGAAIKDGSLAAAVRNADVAGVTNKAYKDKIGVDLKLSGTPQYVEVDDKAAYLIGVMSSDAEVERKKVMVAGAMTLVRGRVFLWGEYAPYTSDADLAALMRRVKVETARFIADNGG